MTDQTSSRLRVGVLGAGGIARSVHVPGFIASGVADVVAVYDPMHDAAVQLAADVPTAVVCETAEELLARADVDAVCICTPNREHAPLSLAAIRAGKHVLCEKPLGMTYAETVAMEEAARRAGRTTAVNFRYRNLPAVQLLKPRIEAGAVGRPYHLLFHYLQGHLVDPTRPATWRMDRSLAGSGALGDLGSHGIDLVRFLLGEVDAVFAELTTFVPERPGVGGGTVKVTVDDASTLLLRMRNGALAVVEATRNAAEHSNYQRLELYGASGSAFYEMDRADAGAETLHMWRQGTKEFDSETVSYDRRGSVTKIIQDFAKAALAGEPTTPNFTDGARCQEIIEAAEMSAAQGRWVALPLTRPHV